MKYSVTSFPAWCKIRREISSVSLDCAVSFALPAYRAGDVSYLCSTRSIRSENALLSVIVTAAMERGSVTVAYVTRAVTAPEITSRLPTSFLCISCLIAEPACRDGPDEVPVHIELLIRRLATCDAIATVLYEKLFLQTRIIWNI